MVQKDSFSFAGVDMLDRYGIRAVSYDVLAPRLRPRLLTVPGRDGSYDFGARRYDDRQVRIACDSRRALSRQEIRELAHLLSKKGRLVLWDEPEKFYMGRLYDDAVLTYLGRVGHAFDLAFVCEPFAYGAAVVKPLGGAVGYEGTAECGTVVRMRNGGTSLVAGVRLRVTRVRAGTLSPP